MQLAAAPQPRLVAAQHPPRSQARRPASAAVPVAASRQAAAPRSAWQLAAGSSAAQQQRRWQRRQQQRLAPAAAAGGIPSPQEFEEKKKKFDSINKDYAVLTQQIEDTSAEVVEGLQGTSLFLVGMMGSGKSTVGKLVSQALGYCFFDTDALIEQLAGKKISQLFAEDGEEEFRAIETQVLAELAPFKNCVIATGGGVPTRAENWGHMQGGVTVWLNGPPALLAHRVVGDGTESRPLLSQGDEAGGEQQSADAYAAAVARLTALLEERAPLYAGSDITVSLEGEGPDAALGVPAMEVCARILLAIDSRIKGDAEERKRRMDFEIVQDDLPATMRVMDSPAAAAAAAAGEEDPLLP